MPKFVTKCELFNAFRSKVTSNGAANGRTKCNLLCVLAARQGGIIMRYYPTKFHVSGGCSNRRIIKLSTHSPTSICPPEGI